jgi:Tfp pilus assembly protein PilO
VNLRGLVDRIRRWYESHGERDRRIIVGVAIAIGVSLAYIGVVEPISDYRAAVAGEIAEGHDRLEQAERFVGALDALRTERDDLKQKVTQARTRLLPGATGAIGAAALQERVNAVAGARGIAVQSTQVMREEDVAPFRKVSVRLTLSGEVKQFAGFLSDLEYGPQALRVPFMEVSRRGAAVAGKGPRALSISLEVSGYLLARAEEPPAAEPGAPAEGGETPPAEGGEPPEQVGPPEGPPPPPPAQGTG